MKNTLALLGLIAAFTAAAPSYAEDASPHEDKAFHHRMSRDADADGFVSRDEFLKRAQANFDKSDADRDGKLSMDERKAAFKKMKARKEEWRAKRKERMDDRHDRPMRHDDGGGEAH